MNWKAFNANRKTTALGSVIGGAIVILTVLNTSIDTGAPFDLWAMLRSEEVMTAILGIVVGVGTMLAGYVTRDADKSSQDSEVRDPAPDAAALEAKIEESVDAAIADALGPRA